MTVTLPANVKPGKTVAVVGDGGFTMAPHVLCTAVEYDLPCIWVVWNNFSWAAIRDIQMGMFGGRDFSWGSLNWSATISIDGGLSARFAT